ncbi:dephospho-CoA kinase [Marinobacteraceae bacterium S3BR75-40.1]
MWVVGLTGGIGSGKSTVASLFENKGIVTVDADEVAREVVEPGQPALKAIADHFGADILDRKGRLDRTTLRHRIFADEAERKWLEALLHPLIRESIVEQLRTAESPYAILVSPLLLETDQHALCQRVLVVDVPPETQIQRTVSRDNNTEEQVRRILAAQMNRDERLAKADDVIDNTDTLDIVAHHVDQLHEEYLALSEQGTNMGAI